MALELHFIEKVFEYSWHYMKVPQRMRERRNRRRLLEVQPDLRAIHTAIAAAFQTLDVQFNTDSFFALIFTVALERAQIVLDRYYPGMSVSISLKTQDTDEPDKLRCWFGQNQPHHRLDLPNKVKTIPIDGTFAGQAFKNRQPIFVKDFSEHATHYPKAYFENFKRFIGSLVVWPIQCDGRGVLGVLKIDSPKKHVFAEDEPTKTLLEHLVTAFCLVFSFFGHLAVRSNGTKPALEIEAKPS